MANVLTMTSPLTRQAVGLDHFSDLFETLLSDTSEGFENHPPYNIEKLSDSEYKIVMDVAGLAVEDLSIIMQDGVLTVSGSVQENLSMKADAEMLHRGIATSAFEQTFSLADYIKVHDAEMKDGLLTIQLVREVPEAKKPHMIAIKSSDPVSKQVIENKKRK